MRTGLPAVSVFLLFGSVEAAPADYVGLDLFTARPPSGSPFGSFSLAAEPQTVGGQLVGYGLVNNTTIQHALVHGLATGEHALLWNGTSASATPPETYSARPRTPRATFTQ